MHARGGGAGGAAAGQNTSLDVPLLGKITLAEEAEFMVCVVGIMSSLGVYGLMQERIVRHPYAAPGSDAAEFFNSSLFLVFCNRIFTCASAAVWSKAKGQPLAPACPLYKYGSISLSNVVATTCQYEALKFVSFPVQTLAKCAKMMPVLVWGTLMSGKRYKVKPSLARMRAQRTAHLAKRSLGALAHLLCRPLSSLSPRSATQVSDYAAAAAVTLSCTFFLLESAGDNDAGNVRPNVGAMGGAVATAYGVGLMVCYLSFDGFTSTFQDKLFAGYEGMSIMNQVFWVTTFSTGVTLLSLVSSGQLWPALAMLMRHSSLAGHVVLLSVAATAGQFFITYTIKQYGALPFATIMTTRQLVSILLSCFMYGPPLNLRQWIALVATFASLYLRNYGKMQGKKARRRGHGPEDASEAGEGDAERLVGADASGGDMELGNPTRRAPSVVAEVR